MRLLPLLLSLCAQSITTLAATDFTDSAAIYIQSVSSAPAPAVLLAEIQFNPSTLDSAIVSFENPELAPGSDLVRVGVYDPSTASWKSSTSAASTENFEKGYSPTFTLTLDAQGAVIGVSLHSAKIDAGQTRDFAPKVKVVQTKPGKLPELNRPVVLSAEGKLEEPVVEKTFLQNYWWIILGAVVLLATSGGGE